MSSKFLFTVVSLATTLTLTLTSATPSSRSSQPPFINHQELVSTGGYPFVVLKPAGENPPSQPPINIFLHGTGSVGDAGIMDITLTWNGPGRRINDYYNGNVNPSSKVVCEEFLTVMPIHPDDTHPPDVPEWNIPNIKAVLDFVTQNYDHDPNRIYLTGYSMGARDSWKIAIAYPSTFAAVAVAAGEPSDQTDFTNLLNTPFRHYIGTKDFEGSSSLVKGQGIQNLIEKAGGKLTELMIVDGPDPANGPAHNQMAEVPWQEPLFDWLLSNNLQATKISSSTTTTTTSSSSSSSASSSNSNGSSVNQTSDATTLTIFENSSGLTTMFFLVSSLILAMA